jgi:hypothetical protein
MPLALSFERLLAVYQPIRYRAFGNHISYLSISIVYLVSSMFTVSVVVANVFSSEQVSAFFRLGFSYV